MKKLIRWLGAADAVALLLTGWAFAVAPAIVPMHWNNLGNQDATAPKAALWWQLLVVVVLSFLIWGIARWRRRRQGLSEVPLVLPQEYGMLFVQAVVVVVLAGTLATQIGWL